MIERRRRFCGRDFLLDMLIAPISYQLLFDLRFVQLSAFAVEVVAVSSDKPNIARARHQDSNTTSARSVARKRSRDGRLRAHVCWRADLGSCRNKA
jgi:hypothetical protein